MAALSRLSRGAVVTGQQAGLLGGPALTFYKAKTALDLASGAEAAAVFWVASQDHDVEEVRHLHLLVEEEVRTLSLPLPPQPAGRIPLAPYRG
ncbi:bacillithiol biosynthesis cysteine-adding enzyme BshC, partial [Shewanella sp. C31]|nr:bacillithiol biosynthesis cysteine-adding enzyme BshC [Shewanella electrica]